MLALKSRCMPEVFGVLCILTSERVLHMPFGGPKQLFNAKTTFCVLLGHKKYKIMQKITKNHVIKGTSNKVLLYFAEK